MGWLVATLTNTDKSQNQIHKFTNMIDEIARVYFESRDVHCDLEEFDRATVAVSFRFRKKMKPNVTKFLERLLIDHYLDDVVQIDISRDPI